MLKAQEYRKQPSEQETLKIAWTRNISSLVVSGYVIYSIDVKIFDSSGTDKSDTMIYGTPSFSGEYVYVTVKGGEDGKDYWVRFKVTLTKSGEPNQIQEEDLRVEVRQWGVS